MVGSTRKNHSVSGVMAALVFALIFLLIPFNFVPPVAAQASPTLELGKAEGSVGEEIVVSVQLKNSKEVAGGEFVLSYDPGMVEPKGVSGTGLLEGALLMPNLDYTADSLKVVWADTKALKKTGEIIRIKFLLKKEGEAILELKEMVLATEVPEKIPDVAGVNGSIMIGPSRGTDPGSKTAPSDKDSSSPDGAPAEKKGDDRTTAREGPALLKVGKARGGAGDTVKVTIMVENPQGMAGGNMVLAYNPGVVEPLKVKPGNLLDGLIPIANLESSEDTISIAWFGLKGKTSDGALLDISFRLKEKGRSPLEIKELSLVNIEGNEIPVEYDDGQITILAAGSLLSAVPDIVVEHYYYFIGAAVIIVAAVVIIIVLLRRRKKRAIV